MKCIQKIDRFHLVIPKNKMIRHSIIVLETKAINLVSNGVRKNYFFLILGES